MRRGSRAATAKRGHRGRGVAGLSAAERLAHCGMCNISVLEATDRYRACGRGHSGHDLLCIPRPGPTGPAAGVHSCWLGDSVVELGAQWLYGANPSNSVYSLAAREGILCCPEDADHEPPLFCTSDGRTVDPPLVRRHSTPSA